jgi:hypothetical protein
MAAENNGEASLGLLSNNVEEESIEAIQLKLSNLNMAAMKQWRRKSASASNASCTTITAFCAQNKRRRRIVGGVWLHRRTAQASRVCARMLSAGGDRTSTRRVRIVAAIGAMVPAFCDKARAAGGDVVEATCFAALSGSVKLDGCLRTSGARALARLGLRRALFGGGVLLAAAAIIFYWYGSLCRQRGDLL